MNYQIGIYQLPFHLWNGVMNRDTVQLPSGKTYTLLNLPLYYAGQLDRDKALERVERTG